MAQSTKKRAKSRSKKKRKSSKKETVKTEERQGEVWDEARDLESQLEDRLLQEAIHGARLALKELDSETRRMPFERRSGLRLKEKARKAERAFNRLRALRQGKLLPEAHPDD